MKKRNLFAGRASLEQGDINACVREIKVARSQRFITPLHDAVLLEDAERVKSLCAKHPEYCRVLDNNGNLPLHLAATTSLEADVVGIILDVYPEALVLRNNDGKNPGTIAHNSERAGRNMRDLLCDGRVQAEGNWVFSRYENDRLERAKSRHEAINKRRAGADAVRDAVAGYVQPRNKQVFLSAHESAR